MRDPALEQRAIALLEQALEWPDDTIESRLREATGEDAVLLDRVRALLGHAHQEDSRIPAEPDGMFFELSRIPERVGAYRLTEVVGEGGMGVVCRGERVDGLFEQTVAIKLMRPGLLSPALSERFSAERRVLAKLNHPNIAQLFDGGVDEAGNSFIVMEFITGTSITEHVRTQTRGDRNAVQLRTTMALFEQCCDAVQAAHQQLIVHADIKPGNVLVTNDGRVKLLDFGIARMLDGDATPTADASEPMTRAYAAPERRAGQPPNVAGDVYALGAMLFELLTGSLPEAVTKTMLSVATPAPAAATHTRNDAPTAPQQREVLVPAWNAPSKFVANEPTWARQLRGDLDAIVLRAVAADPAARYATVAELQSDVRAWRENRPLLARSSAGAGYRIGKFLRRNALLASAASALLIVLVAATAITQAQYRAAERARADATRRFDEARAMSKYMLFDLFDRLKPIPGTLLVRQNLAATAQSYLDRLNSIANAPIDVRLETAAGYVRLAGIQGGSGHENLGDIDGYRHNMARAEGLYQGLMRDAPQRADVWRQATDLYTQQAYQAMHSDNRMDVAERLFNAADNAAAHAEKLAPNDANIAEAKFVLLNYRIDLLQWLSRNAEAVAAGERAIAALSHLPASLRDAANFPMRGASLFKRHAESLRYAGRAREAIPFSARSVAYARQAITKNPGQAWPLRGLSMDEWSFGQTLMDVGEPAQALVHFDAAIALSTQTLRLDADNDQLQRTDMINRSDRVLALSALRRHKEALQAFAQVLATATARAKAAPSERSRTRDLWEQQQILGNLQVNAGNVSAGCATWRELLPKLTRLREQGEMAASDVKELLGELQQGISKHCA